LQKSSRLFGPQTAANFEAMVGSTLLHYIENRPEGTASWLGASEDHAGDTGMQQRANTHNAWFRGYVKRRSPQTVVALLECRLSEH